MKWRSSSDTDWKRAIEEYDRKLQSGELKFNAIGDIIPDKPEAPGWLAFLMSRLPPDNFSRRR